MAEGGRKKETGLTDENLRTVQELLADLRYGSVTLVVQDGRVIQIEKHEKVRLT